MPPQLEAAIRTLLDQKNQVILAIDGPCGGGKSTLAKAISQRFPDSLVIHADDFFLQPHQRTPERLGEPGGNLDRERLLEEALKPLKAGNYLGHHRYNCQTGEMEEVPGVMMPLAIIEGSYSHHPALRDYYDLAVYLDIDETKQLARLKERGPAVFAPFPDTWIPMENAYFSCFKIRDRADIRLRAE